MSKSQLPKAILIIATLALFSTKITAAPNSYRYKDAAGVTYIGDSVPPGLVNNGYEILNERGRVIDVVLPRSELNLHASKALKEAERRHKLELQRSKEETLLRYYSAPEDVERVQARKLEEFDNFIAMQEGNIISFRKKIAHLQRQAANLERGGQNVPSEILEAMKTLESKLHDAEGTIDKKKQERQETYEAFDADLQLLKQLVGPTKARQD